MDLRKQVGTRPVCLVSQESGRSKANFRVKSTVIFFPVLQDHINVNDLRMRTMTGRDVFSFGKEEDTQRGAFSSCSNFDTFPLKSSCKITLLEFRFLFLVFDTNLHV